MNGNDKSLKLNWKDTCATRLSHALNEAGFKIPYSRKYQTWSGANNLNYIVSSQRMFEYLDATYYQQNLSPLVANILNVGRINWGIIAHYNQATKRVGHVDVMWKGVPTGRFYTWSSWYIFGEN